ncbi:hypothetical protein OCV73_03650 [Barnesiella propionica]|uniref:hypothetical protein n=1 Tax=Barnesiella propionica TaxID=2981781 RepID=UPI0011C9FC1E|nr:hypothetical protein [Barnesiella propionica]MCU6768044.1 hypothetical protein [Barnesiella propionica]
MDKTDLNRFIRKVLLALVPLYILLAFYLWSDPFKVVQNYDSFYEDGKPSYVTLDVDYVSTSTFDKYNKIYRYDSFVMGNSRSIFYEVDDWMRHLDDSSSCFHFDASAESLFGIYKKIIYLDSRVPIKNLLFVWDASILLQTERREESHLYFLSPQLEGYKRWFAFHSCFIRTFFTPRFLIAYCDFKISGQMKDYMKREGLLNDDPITYSLRYNEIRHDIFEEEIKAGTYYNEKRMKVFYDRPSKEMYSEAFIGEKQIKMLKEIASVLARHRANVKIVISPLYDQKKMAVEDIEILKDIFGENVVYDFSGKNEFTEDYRNYYECSHYRPHVARAILDSIY